MLSVDLVEGIEMQVQHVPKRQLAEAWKTLSKKPFPKVRMLRLSDEDFNHVLQHRHCLEDDLREIEEWGRVLSTKGTDACIFNAEDTDDADYIILVRQNPYHSNRRNHTSRVGPHCKRRPLTQNARAFFLKQPEPINARQIYKVKHEIGYT